MKIYVNSALLQSSRHRLPSPAQGRLLQRRRAKMAAPPRGEIPPRKTGPLRKVKPALAPSRHACPYW